MPRTNDPLVRWLSLSWERPERSYNPDLRDFLAGLLGYPKTSVITEDTGPSGYPDLKLVGPEGFAWVVGDMKKDDGSLTVPARRQSLWQDKRKYVDGLTRFVLFLTAHYVWVTLPTGEAAPGFEEPLDLRAQTLEGLQSRLGFLKYEAASHARQWQEFVAGAYPFSYLHLENDETLKALRRDLRAGFGELRVSSTQAITALRSQYDEYRRRRDDIERNLVGKKDAQRRARVRVDLEFEFVRRLFSEALPQFEEQYGREADSDARVGEAFIADSVAALMARVLFLRLVEDLGLTQKRRLSNGGPHHWADFIEYLTGDARALVRIASEDVARLYREPFARSVFDWIQHANGDLDEALQRFILRLNAYDFAGLSEEILGDIYQQFLPPQKRKQLGEYYTPVSIVEWILDHTVRRHGLGPLLDPSCGSGSFLVRYAHWRLADAAARRLDPSEVRREVEDELWGFDLNPFAAFISLFQITWALLRFQPQGDPPAVHVYNINSLLQDTDIVAFLGEEHLAPGSKARDERKWKYVLGNPPYIRAERVKYGEEMRDLWAHVWGQNSDTGLIFLYRALTEWLEPGGFLGMVVSGGYANSEASAKVWNLLHPGGQAALRHVVWLEFAGKLWEPNVIPMLLIIERKEALPDDEIALHVPAAWPGADAPNVVRYADFWDKRVSPNGTNPVSLWGNYLLPLLKAEDVPILRQVYPEGQKYARLGEVVKWTYGIQRGGVELTPEPVGERPLQVIAGRSLAVAWPGEPAGWVDMAAVEKRPYGKPSLWRGPIYPTKFLAVAKFGLAPFAAAVEAQSQLASLDTATVAGTYDVSPEAVAAYLNSKLVRFYWAAKLRAGVLEGSSRATIYPRSLDALPWPKDLTPEQEQALADGYDRLAGLAARAKNNPNEWLLAEAERRIAVGPLRMSDPRLGLTFAGGVVEARAGELRQEGDAIQTGLLTFAQFGDADAAEYVYRVLTLTAEEDALLKAADVQKLVVPGDYAALMQEYRGRWAAFGSVEQDFRAAMAQVDVAVYSAFDIDAPEQAYIAQRLASFPLNRLQPRYPWQAVKPRPIKAYTEDRFA